MGLRDESSLRPPTADQLLQLARGQEVGGMSIFSLEAEAPQSAIEVAVSPKTLRVLRSYSDRFQFLTDQLKASEERRKAALRSERELAQKAADGKAPTEPVDVEGRFSREIARTKAALAVLSESAQTGGLPEALAAVADAIADELARRKSALDELFGESEGRAPSQAEVWLCRAACLLRNEAKRRVTAPPLRLLDDLKIKLVSK